MSVRQQSSLSPGVWWRISCAARPNAPLWDRAPGFGRRERVGRVYRAAGRRGRVHGAGGGAVVSGDLCGGVLRHRARSSDRLESDHGNAPALPWADPGLAAIGAWYLRTPAKVLIGRLSAPLRRQYRRWRMGNGGSAGFAGICEEWSHRWRPGRVFLGHSMYSDSPGLSVSDDRMMTVLGANGSGKDETVIIPNLLQYDKRSVFRVDIKGQCCGDGGSAPPHGTGGLYPGSVQQSGAGHCASQSAR